MSDHTKGYLSNAEIAEELAQLIDAECPWATYVEVRGTSDEPRTIVIGMVGSAQEVYLEVSHS